MDPDETPHSAASHLGLHCLLGPVCPDTYGKYVTWFETNTRRYLKANVIRIYSA